MSYSQETNRVFNTNTKRFYFIEFLRTNTMCEQKNEDYGIVYALINEAMPGLVKIGMTSRLEITQRMKELYNSTGVPLPFECIYACEVKDFVKVEKALHIAFDPDRINPNREFFRIAPERVIAILELLGPNNIKKEVNNDIDNEVSVEERGARENMKKRSAFNFERMGIPVGSKLFFTKDSSIEIEVTENGNIMSLTAATKQFIPYVVHPTPYWTYMNENLEDIWKNSLHEN